MTSTHSKLNYLGITSLILLLAACYPDKEAIQELYDRQTTLEAKMDRLADDLEAGMSRIETDIQAVETGQAKLARDLEGMREQTIRKNMETAAAKKPGKQQKASAAESSQASEKKKSSPNNTPALMYNKAVKSYNDGKFEDAILEYQKLIDTYPKDKRVPEAYLRQGMALINLGRKDEAKFFLNALIDKYPNSNEAQTAREKLKTI